MPKYKLTIQYLGAGFSGSQKQPNGKTIQDELEKTISTLTKQKTSTIFSGRTDKGVSAMAQVVHFETEKEIEKYKFLYSLNSLLPKGISVLKIEKVNNRFHAQKDATYKHYQYLIRSSGCENVFDVNCLHVRQKLDIEKMNQALSHIKGEHDFSAFKTSSENPAKVCNIYEAKASKSGDVIKIDIVGDRFLYNMVRTIVGTLLLIEKDNLEPTVMAEILNSKNRTKAGSTADAVGLTLLKVGYDNKYKRKAK